MRILLVEDDGPTRETIELMLRAEGFNPYSTDQGEEAIDLAKLYDYDLMLLDLNLPDMPGLQVLRTIRVSKVATPVICVTGCADLEDKIKALSFGADDYVTKPFHKDELVARMHAVIRRSRGLPCTVVEMGELTLNLSTRHVEVRGRRVHLTGKEYGLLELLILRSGTTLSKEMILNHLYGGLDEPQLKIVDVFVCKLRKKLAAIADGNGFIETVWGRGYLIRPIAIRAGGQGGPWLEPPHLRSPSLSPAT